jgi:hypothetical protein
VSDASHPTPAERFLALGPARRRFVQERLVEQSLARWQAYVRSQGVIRYSEGVCGTVQTLDASLPQDALAAVRSGEGAEAVAARYLEPIAALQDKDLVFPDAVELAYYAVYNFFEKYALGQEVDDWLLVNQAGSSEESQPNWMPVLLKTIQAALGAVPE